MNTQIEEWQLIQLAYPTEYDYSTLSDYTLLQLARHYIEEPNTATLAMGELVARKNDEVEQIAKAMLDNANSDKFLIASALRDISSVNLSLSLIYLRKYGLSEEVYLTKEVTDILVNIGDSALYDGIKSLVLSLNDKIKSNIELYLEDQDFVENSYNDFLKKYSLV